MKCFRIALWFVDFSLLWAQAACDMSHLGETKLDVWLQLRDKLSVFVFAVQ